MLQHLKWLLQQNLVHSYLAPWFLFTSVSDYAVACRIPQPHSATGLVCALQCFQRNDLIPVDKPIYWNSLVFMTDIFETVRVLSLCGYSLKWKLKGEDVDVFPVNLVRRKEGLIDIGPWCLKWKTKEEWGGVNSPKTMSASKACLWFKSGWK